ncbi:hypothetical protein, partial [cf. Phormidesmis sp. LEGE 11477]|uniref:hypothetical protein n=1 Tax=cf. Phormidesmis sp. LEGE 11477 TaxID=1828680 RepID=UPI001A055D13
VHEANSPNVNLDKQVDDLKNYARTGNGDYDVIEGTGTDADSQHHDIINGAKEAYDQDLSKNDPDVDSEQNSPGLSRNDPDVDSRQNDPGVPGNPDVDAEQNSPGYSGAIVPIVLDLDGDGVELVDVTQSTAFYDFDGDGYRNRVGWVAADDGLLAYDKNGDGQIVDADEIAFTSYVEGALTDLEGLTHFDSNSDGVLDSSDDEFGSFGVWQDIDQDGESDPGEFVTLSEAGIASIQLTSNQQERDVGLSKIFGEGFYTNNNQQTGVFADAQFSASAFGFKETSEGILFGHSDGRPEVLSSSSNQDQVVDLKSLQLSGYFSGAGNDVLGAGSENSDSVLLHGGDGDDTITGGLGSDWLVGGEVQMRYSAAPVTTSLPSIVPMTLHML